MKLRFHMARMAKPALHGREKREKEGYGNRKQEDRRLIYVLQVAPGMEEKTEALIRGQVGREIYGCCFHPLRHVRKKLRGEWKDLHEKLLPGYVFVRSDRVKELYGELRRVPVLTKLLGQEEENFTALSWKEVEWLERLTNSLDPLQAGKRAGEFAGQEAISPTVGKEEIRHPVEVGLSQISVSEQDVITILSGPLKNVEGQIRKINLHKRIAEVEVDFMGRKTIIYLGVEMVRRKELRG